MIVAEIHRTKSGNEVEIMIFLCIGNNRILPPHERLVKSTLFGKIHQNRVDIPLKECASVAIASLFLLLLLPFFSF